MILMILLSYKYLQPMGNGIHLLQESEYTLKTDHIGQEDGLPAFYLDGNSGTFSINTGKAGNPKGTFVFEKELEVFMGFSTQGTENPVRIEFAVIHNNKEVAKKVATKDAVKQISFFVKKGDVVKVVADQGSGTDVGRGSLQIITRDASTRLEQIVIPFLWIILFVYLFGKKHSYIAVNSYFIFLLVLLAEKLNFGPLEFDNILVYLLLIFSMTFIFTFCYQELSRLKRYRVASTLSYLMAIVVYVVPLMFIIYALNFEAKATKDILYAVFQTNVGESYEYLSSFISTKYLLLFVFVTSFVGFLLYKQEKKETHQIEKITAEFYNNYFFKHCIDAIFKS